MKEEFEKYEKTKNSISSLLACLETINKNFAENAPNDLCEKAKEFHEFLEKYDVESLRPKPASTSGKFFDIDVIEKEITNSTGYVWTMRLITDNEELDDTGNTKEDIEYRYNISPTEIKVFEFYRASKSRGELWRLELVLMPGCAFIGYDTGRVSGGSDVCYSEKELIKYIGTLN